jgi:hypothetical protein
MLGPYSESSHKVFQADRLGWTDQFFGLLAPPYNLFGFFLSGLCKRPGILFKKWAVWRNFMNESTMQLLF